jgi:hypothetical protein
MEAFAHLLKSVLVSINFFLSLSRLSYFLSTFFLGKSLEGICYINPYILETFSNSCIVLFGM